MFGRKDWPSLFHAEAHAAVRRYQRADGLETGLAEAFAALEPVFRLKDVVVTVGGIDEHGFAEPARSARLTAGELWPEGTPVEVMATVGAMRVAMPDGANLRGDTSFACADGFLRKAPVVAAPALGGIPTVWVEGGR